MSALQQQRPSDADLAKLDAEYEASLERIKSSGPHVMSPELMAKNRLLRETLRANHGVYTIPDVHKLSDCDLYYRFLIARKWDVSDAVEGVTNYIKWRAEMRMDTILKESVDESLGDMPPFMGQDKDGYPIMYNTPDPTILKKLIQSESRETVIRRHLIVMERGRYLCKKFGVDRISCIFDLSNVTMASITSEVMGLLKEMSHLDQVVYPENMRRMIVCNGGWAVSAAWKVVRPLLDKRVQQKISFVSGSPSLKILQEYIEASQVPVRYGGTCTGEQDVNFAALMTSPVEAPAAPLSPGAIPPHQEAPNLSFTKSKRDPESEDEGGSDGFYSIDSIDEVASPVVGDRHDDRRSASQHRNPDAAAIEAPLRPLPRQTRDGSNGAASSSRSVDFHPSAASTVDSIFAQMKLQMAGRDVGTIPPAKPGMRVPGCLIRLEKCSSSLKACIGDVQVAYQKDTNIFRGSTQELMCKVVRDSKHSFHAYGLLTDAANQVRYAVKKRHLHDQLHIFDIQGSRQLITEDLESTVNGDKIHILTVSPNEASGDLRDWVLKRHRTKSSPFSMKPSKDSVPALITKVGSVVSVTPELLAGEIDPEAVVSLILCIVHLWRYSTL